MTALPDAEARRLALDPRRSLCVVAPAGSGKTELLTRRFLGLLATAREPEEILAFTFTRKAAAEMRERLLQHLSAAELEAAAVGDSGGTGAVAASAADEAMVLARAALARDRERGWELLRNPSRLSVQTIDSFCAWLAAQLPVLSALGGVLAISVDEAGARREAAQLLLDELERGGELGAALEVLLEREDNNVEVVLQLCGDMLARRDHWLPLVSYGDAAGHGSAAHRARAALAAARRQLWREHAAAARDLLGAALPSLGPLLAAAACTLRERGARRAPAPALVALAGAAEEDALAAECHRLLCAPQPRAEDEPRAAAVWAAVSALLLDAKGQWRRRVDATQGFPPAAAAAKQSLGALLDDLRGRESEPLLAMSRLPGAAVEDSEWRALAAVQLLLWHSAARLELVFAERREIDYIGKAMAAVRALGAGDDAPSELAMALGCRLRHILVDEFQDTSHSQFQLLERLVAGWAEHNESDPQAPCTLFAVGDSMQSCYAFRNADPRLFQRLQDRGINGLALETVALSANFRSRAELIDWVNACFGPLFGQRRHASRGAVPYCPATAVRGGGGAVAEVCCEQLAYGEGLALSTQAEAERAEAERVLHWIESARAEQPAGSIAVLVRSRSHLGALLPTLARAGLSWSAEAMEPLAARPAVRDLAALTQALADPADRLAWLAILRAPWCGLGHAALQQLVSGGRQLLWQRCLACAGSQSGLATAEQRRLARFVEALSPAMARRARVPHAELTESAWLALGGPACFLPGVDQAQDVAALFALLRELGREPQAAELQWRLERLYAAPAGDGRLQLMTIHNAKGLEFDTVILCGLHRRPRHDEPPLMCWESRHFDGAGDGCGAAVAVRVAPTGWRWRGRALRLSAGRGARARLVGGEAPALCGIHACHPPIAAVGLRRSGSRAGGWQPAATAVAIAGAARELHDGERSRVAGKWWGRTYGGGGGGRRRCPRWRSARSATAHRQLAAPVLGAGRSRAVCRQPR